MESIEIGGNEDPQRIVRITLEKERICLQCGRKRKLGFMYLTEAQARVVANYLLSCAKAL